MLTKRTTSFFLSLLDQLIHLQWTHYCWSNRLPTRQAISRIRLFKPARVERSMRISNSKRRTFSSKISWTIYIPHSWTIRTSLNVGESFILEATIILLLFLLVEIDPVNTITIIRKIHGQRKVVELTNSTPPPLISTREIPITTTSSSSSKCTWSINPRHKEFIKVRCKLLRTANVTATATTVTRTRTISSGRSSTIMEDSSITILSKESSKETKIPPIRVIQINYSTSVSLIRRTHNTFILLSFNLRKTISLIKVCSRIILWLLLLLLRNSSTLSINSAVK